MTTLEFDKNLDYKVADMSQADFGLKEMDIAEREMPGLMAVRAKYGKDKPLQGLKVTGSLHMTIQTAMLIESLRAIGADIRWASCNIFSTQGPRRCGDCQAGHSGFCLERRDAGGVLVVHRAGPHLAGRVGAGPYCR